VCALQSPLDTQAIRARGRTLRTRLCPLCASSWIEATPLRVSCRNCLLIGPPAADSFDVTSPHDRELYFALVHHAVHLWNRRRRSPPSHYSTCPFCGRAALAIRLSNLTDFGSSQSGHLLQVCCCNCHAESGFYEPARSYANWERRKLLARLPIWVRPHIGDPVPRDILELFWAQGYKSTARKALTETERYPQLEALEAHNQRELERTRKLREAKTRGGE
jgi:hypothetical protein